MGIINYLIVRILVNTKFANIINIAANEEIIPELLQSDCNAKKIFNTVTNFLDNPNKMEQQVLKTQSILNNFKTNVSPSKKVAESLIKYLI